VTIFLHQFLFFTKVFMKISAKFWRRFIKISFHQKLSWKFFIFAKIVASILVFTEIFYSIFVVLKISQQNYEEFFSKLLFAKVFACRKIFVSILIFVAEILYQIWVCKNIFINFCFTKIFASIWFSWNFLHKFQYLWKFLHQFAYFLKFHINFHLYKSFCMHVHSRVHVLPLSTCPPVHLLPHSAQDFYGTAGEGPGFEPWTSASGESRFF
jgi:hypothetical protein